jgi:hypothetical protein
VIVQAQTPLTVLTVITVPPLRNHCTRCHHCNHHSRPGGTTADKWLVRSALWDGFSSDLPICECFFSLGALELYRGKVRVHEYDCEERIIAEGALGIEFDFSNCVRVDVSILVKFDGES